MPLFITFEGGDGAGKTTQVRLLVAHLEAAGRQVVAVREPGGTALGEQIRPWVKGVELAPETELLLFSAARAQLVREVIRPALAQDKVVVADRFADSTVAYQGYGRGLPLELIRAVNQAATAGLKPDITFLLDLPAEKGLDRTGAKAPRKDNPTESKFERETLDFHRRLRSGFLRLAGEEPRRILVLDASNPVEQIAAAVWARVERLLA